MTFKFNNTAKSMVWDGHRSYIEYVLILFLPNTDYIIRSPRLRGVHFKRGATLGPPKFDQNEKS